MVDRGSGRFEASNRTRYCQEVRATLCRAAAGLRSILVARRGFEIRVRIYVDLNSRAVTESGSWWTGRGPTRFRVQNRVRDSEVDTPLVRTFDVNWIHTQSYV